MFFSHFVMQRQSRSKDYLRRGLHSVKPLARFWITSTSGSGVILYEPGRATGRKWLAPNAGICQSMDNPVFDWTTFCWKAYLCVVMSCACSGPSHSLYLNYYCSSAAGTIFNVFSYDTWRVLGPWLEPITFSTTNRCSSWYATV